MKPFRTSLSARILSGGAALAMAGAGLIPVLGLDPARSVPVVILITIAAGMAGLFAGLAEHGGPTLFATILLPLAMWAFVLGMVVVINVYPQLGWALLAGAAVPLALFIASLGTRPEPASLPARRHA